jgi:hypothetical protein
VDASLVVRESTAPPAAAAVKRAKERPARSRATS